MKSSFLRTFTFAAMVPLMMAFANKVDAQVLASAANNDNNKNPFALFVSNNHASGSYAVAPPTTGGEGVSGDDPPEEDAAAKAFTADAPNADRPYYYIKYDATTMAADSCRLPSGQVAPDGALVIHNYITEGEGAKLESHLQNKVLAKILKALGEKLDVPIMLVDVVVYDKEGNPVYTEAVVNAMQENTLGKGKTNIPVERSGMILDADASDDPEQPKLMMPPYAVVTVNGDIKMDLAIAVSASGNPILVYVDPETKKLAGDTELFFVHADAIKHMLVATAVWADGEYEVAPPPAEPTVANNALTTASASDLPPGPSLQQP